MFQRKLLPILNELLDEFRIVYLTGPRQAGKTTLAKEIAQISSMDYVSLDDSSVLASAKNDPHGFIQTFENKKIIIDEFQYAPELVPAIKEASDKLKPDFKGKFFLTGSADIFRSAKTQEALPGHMARVELYPLSLSELSGNRRNIMDYFLTADFGSNNSPTITKEQLAQQIINGGYPEIQNKSKRAQQIWFKSYMEGRLLKDFESLYAARGDYYSKIQALVPYLAGISSNLLKYSSISNDLAIDEKTIKSYVEILDLMFIVRRLPPYLKNRSKRLIQMSKIQFIDTGLACHLLGLRTPQQLVSSPYYGAFLENFIYLELLKQSGWCDNEVELFHFRDNRKNEVDLVIEQGNGDITGIEVKASSTISERDFRGLRVLSGFAGNKFARGILIYTGQEILPFRFDDKHFFALPISLLYPLVCSTH
ncbi:MAG: putative AAA+ superfamily ATPase [Arenicella sp.]|jgi:predicted AAA+ superfamily ATPase